MKKSMAVFLSGSGRSLENFIRMLPDISIDVVISSKNNVRGIEIAKDHGIPVYVVERKKFPDHKVFSEAVNVILKDYPVSLIVLAGFLSRYDYPDEYEGRVMNIHPALIPSFSGQGYYGMKVHEAVWKSGVRVTGCTVHFADREYDHGAIILQKVCPVFSHDDPHTIADRVFALEQQAFPEAIRMFLDSKLQIKDNRVIIEGD